MQHSRENTKSFKTKNSEIPSKRTTSPNSISSNYYKFKRERGTACTSNQLSQQTSKSNLRGSGPKTHTKENAGQKKNTFAGRHHGSTCSIASAGNKYNEVSMNKGSNYSSVNCPSLYFGLPSSSVSSTTQNSNRYQAINGK